MDLYSVVEYFNKFGGTHNKWDRRRGQFGDFYVVQFACIDDAETILRKRYHRIKNYVFTVEQFDEPAIGNAAAGEPFLRVNQKHWDQILNYLDVLDLCAVANTCTLLKKMAEQVFSSKFDHITWRAGNQSANDIFDTFGHLISSLDVDIVDPCADFDRIVGKCMNLRNLSVWMNGDRFAPLNDGTRVGLQVLFSQLHQLSVNCRQFFDCKTAIQLFIHCSSLESFAINCASSFDSVCNKINVCFGQLKEIKLQLNATINDHGLETLLNCNRGVKTLYIDECPRLTSKSIEIIACCVPWLEQLTLGPLKNFGQADLCHLGTLRYLKSVEILLDPAVPLMNVIYSAGIPIERLALWYVNVTGTLVEQLTRMKSIRSLTICSYTVTNNHLKLIADKLPLLTELRLAGSKYVTIEGLTNMLYSTQKLIMLQLNNVTHVKDKYYLQAFVDQTFRGKPSIAVENF